MSGRSPGAISWRLVLAMLAFGWSLGAATVASGSALDLFGFGARGPALSGSVVSLTDDGESVYYNPAGLAQLRQLTVVIGVQGAELSLRGTGDPLTAAAADAASASTAAVITAGLPLPLPEPLRNRLFLGIGLYVPSDAILRARLPAPYTPQLAVVGNRANSIAVTAALAARATPWLRLGVGVRALARLLGSIEVEPDPQGRLSSRVRDELLAEFAVTAGAQFGPWEGFSAGVAFRDEHKSTFIFPIQADLGEQFPIEVPELRIAGTAQFDPRQVQFGASYRAPFGVSFELDVLWRQWSRMPVPLENATEAVAPQPAPGASDTWSPRVGVEGTWEFGDWSTAARLGYAFEPSPLGTQSGQRNLLDNDRHLWSVGLGVRYAFADQQSQPDRPPPSLGLNAYFQHHLLEERSHRKPPDSGLSPQFQKTSGQIYSFGATLEVRL